MVPYLRIKLASWLFYCPILINIRDAYPNQPLQLTASFAPENWCLGDDSFLFGAYPVFRCILAVSFREGMWINDQSLHPITGILGVVPRCLGSFLVISCWFHWGYPPNQLLFLWFTCLSDPFPASKCDHFVVRGKKSTIIHLSRLVYLPHKT